MTRIRSRKLADAVPGIAGWPVTAQQLQARPVSEFHDLRHTGNQLAAEASATSKELTRRMGRSPVRAAMRYQHSTDRRDVDIAAEMSRRAKGRIRGD